MSSGAEALFRAADKELKDLRRQEQEARHNPTMSRKDHTDLITIIRENIRQVQEEARKAYRKIKEREPML